VIHDVCVTAKRVHSGQLLPRSRAYLCPRDSRLTSCITLGDDEDCATDGNGIEPYWYEDGTRNDVEPLQW
jgi:hypothetical protein